MDKKTLIFILIALVILLVVVNVFRGDREPEPVVDEPTPPAVEETEIVVESLLLNGEEGPLTLTTDDPSVITATVRNDSDEEKEVVLIVRMEGEQFDERHDWPYTVAPGEILEIEESREDHLTWYPGVFTVELEGHTIEVTVE